MPARACDVFLIAVYVLERDSKSKLHMADISQWHHLITLSRLVISQYLYLTDQKFSFMHVCLGGRQMIFFVIQLKNRI
jgi:hypothetical protein